MTTVKLRNLQVGYDLQRLVKELGALGFDFQFVRIFSYSKGRPYAFVDFLSQFDAEEFMLCIRKTKRTDRLTLATGSLAKRDAQFAKQQGAEILLNQFKESDPAEPNTWRAPHLIGK
jgi:hypothetical protein